MSRRTALTAFGCALLVGIIYAACISLFVAPAQPHHQGAVSQVDRLYACVTPAGTVSKVRAYRIGCPPDAQTVTWKVSAP